MTIELTRKRQQVYNLLTPEYKFLEIQQAVEDYENNCKEWCEECDYNIKHIMTYL